MVDHRFEELKRYNISEIFDPTPKEAVKEEQVNKEKKAEEVTAEVVSTTVVDDNTGKAETEAVKDVVAEGDGGLSVGAAVVDV